MQRYPKVKYVKEQTKGYKRNRNFQQDRHKLRVFAFAVKIGRVCAKDQIQPGGAGMCWVAEVGNDIVCAEVEEKMY